MRADGVRRHDEQLGGLLDRAIGGGVRHYTPPFHREAVARTSRLCPARPSALAPLRPAAGQIREASETALQTSSRAWTQSALLRRRYWLSSCTSTRGCRI